MSKRKAPARERRATGYTVGTGRVRRRKMNGAARTTRRRRTMRGMSTASIMGTVGSMAQIGVGMLAYGFTAAKLRKAMPETNPHLLNAGIAAGGVLLGEVFEPARKVAIGLGGAAIGNSALQLLPADLMNGSHTQRRRELNATEKAAIEKRIAQAGLEMGNGGRMAGFDAMAGNGSFDAMAGGSNRPDVLS